MILERQNKSNSINLSKIEENLSSFIGTTQYYRYSPIFPNFYLTDGTKYLGEELRAFWLYDIIASFQSHSKIKDNEKLRSIQFWTLNVSDNKGRLFLEEDRGVETLSYTIGYTDFPLESTRLWVQPLALPVKDQIRRGWVCHLPFEY